MAVRDVVQAAAGVGGAGEYVEDVFSTYLFVGNDATLQIQNGINLAEEGGLIWEKTRNEVATWNLYDTERGVTKRLMSNNSFAEQTTTGLTSFNTDGVTLASGDLNYANYNHVLFSFRKAPKFFDVVTYTGNGVAGRTIPHNLGSVPGTIIVKSTNNAIGWAVYHHSLGATKYLTLNLTDEANTNPNYWNDTEPTSTNFTVAGTFPTNRSDYTYVAYLFAHDAGGFGDDGEQNVISCGSYTGNSSSLPNTISLGFEPQWVMVKKSNGSSDWAIWDVMRGMSLSNNAEALEPNTSDAESATGNIIVYPTADGFEFNDASDFANINGGTYIYIAIRRPMKTPESGTEVFDAVARTGTGANATITSNFVTDLIISRGRTHASYQINAVTDRLRGPLKYLITNNANSLDPTQAEATGTNTITSFAKMTGVDVGSDAVGFCNINTIAYINWMFRRAPGFFDVVAYTGTGSARTVSHNLGVAPELMIIKNRNSGFYGWSVYHSATGNTNRLEIDSNAGASGVSSWNSTNPTENVFTLGDENGVNRSEYTYIAYLFATLPGISKVGSYTGNGTSQTIDCGFSAGARFVLTKRYDGGGYWNIWDSERGIVAGNDPRLGLNRNTVEDTGHDYIDPDNSGFIVNYVADNFEDSNVNGNEYLFLAIA